MHKTFKMAAAAASLALLSACGGGDSAATPAAQVAGANTTATINATTGQQLVQALTGVNLAFSAGVPAFGTVGNTSVAIAGSGSAPTFSVNGDGITASGNLGFGSCIFTIGTSNAPASHPLAAGKTIVVSPCEIQIPTAGASVGTPVAVDISVKFGTVVSVPVKTTAAISASGSLTITNPVSGAVIPAGTVTLRSLTGAS